MCDTARRAQLNLPRRLPLLSRLLLSLSLAWHLLSSHSSGSLGSSRYIPITVLALISSLLSICCAVCLNGLCTLRTFQFQCRVVVCEHTIFNRLDAEWVQRQVVQECSLYRKTRSVTLSSRRVSFRNFDQTATLQMSCGVHQCALVASVTGAVVRGGEVGECGLTSFTRSGLIDFLVLIFFIPKSHIHRKLLTTPRYVMYVMARLPLELS